MRRGAHHHRLEDFEALCWRRYAKRLTYPEAALASDKAWRAWRQGGRYRGLDRVVADETALAFMQAVRIRTGIRSVHRLARVTLSLGMVPGGGTTASRVDRLARKYRRRRAFNPWWLDLFLTKGGPHQGFFAYAATLGGKKH